MTIGRIGRVTSHAAASTSINKIARFFFDSFSDSAGSKKQALTFAAKQQRQNVHSGFIFERRKFGQ